MSEIAVAVNLVLLLAAYAGGGLGARLAVLALTLVACRGSWSDKDAASASAAAHAEAWLLDACRADGGRCEPGDVRALERAAYCANASMLYRHGEDLDDAGIACRR